MPNWETNNVVILGSPTNIRSFVAEAFTDGEIDFEKIVPPPANIEQGGCNGQHEEGVVCWYDWNLQNWGTKWNATHHDGVNVRWLQKYGEPVVVYGRVDLRFDTAWSQPTPIFEAIEATWDVTVHCVTQDEGGFPDVIFGDPYGEEVIRKVIAFEFDSYETEVDEPTEVQA